MLEKVTEKIEAITDGARLTGQAESVSMVASKNDYSTFENETTRGYTVEEAINHIGCGRSQLRIVFIGSIVWIIYGMQTLMLNIIGPIAACAWEITDWQQALVTSMGLIGLVVGSWFFGIISDKYGRRKSQMISAIVSVVFGIACALATNIYWLIGCRFGVGFGVSGIIQVVTYFAEFLPVNIRGKCILLIEIFFALGGFIEVMLASFIIDPFGWRWWMIASGLPIVSCFICAYYFPMSPRYLIACGKLEEATKVLKSIAEESHATLPEGKLIAEQEVDRGNFVDLFAPGYKLTSFLIAVLWLFSTFCYFGIVILTTTLLSLKTNCQSGNIFANVTDGGPVIPCEPLTEHDYLELMGTSAADLPGILLAIIFVDTTGRRFLIGFTNLLFAVTCVLLLICMTNLPMVILLIIGRASLAPSVQLLLVYTPEVYPTHVRALSVGVGTALGMFGGVLSTYVIEALTHLSIRWTISLFGTCGFISAIAGFALPTETMGKRLQ